MFIEWFIGSEQCKVVSRRSRDPTLVVVDPEESLRVVVDPEESLRVV